MILLTTLTLVNKDCHNKMVEAEDVVAICPWAVVTVQKYMYSGGEKEGAIVHLTDGHAPLIVTETFQEVVEAVERYTDPTNIEKLPAR